ncbi:hypothetical protein FCV25MIE_16170, partial [Fagus crenata]
ILHVNDIDSGNVLERLDEFGTLGTVHNEWALAVDVVAVPHRMEAFMRSRMGRVWVESVAMSPSRDWMVATGRAARRG